MCGFVRATYFVAIAGDQDVASVGVTPGIYACGEGCFAVAPVECHDDLGERLTGETLAEPTMEKPTTVTG